MRRLFLSSVPIGALALGAVLWSWPQGPAAEPTAEPPRPRGELPAAPRSTTGLPITQLSLFSSGVAHVQRQGEVHGNERIVLSFPMKDINDLLKSLEVEDQGGGQVHTVGYASQDPVDKALQSYTLNLAGNPSFVQVLSQARGEKVEVQLKPGGGQPAQLNGTLMGVEKQRQTAGKESIEVELLTLWCADGMRSVKLADVQRVRFLNPLLEGDIQKALDLLTQSHDAQNKTVALSCTGKGKRTVKVGYVIEHPVWKTSYRLTLGKDQKPKVKGWAMVENPSAEDWRDVHLNLVSGQPISFRMDLYAPLYVPRPLVEPELFAGLRPPRYSAPLDPGLPRPEEDARPVTTKSPAPAAPPGEPAVETVNLGESFVYSIDAPVSLPRQQSVLVPILHKDVAVSRVSIYNEKVQARHPLLGLRFKNTTGLHLNQGPVTVYEESSYGGDAQLPDLQPNEERLLSYAIDLGTEVAVMPSSGQQRLIRVKIHKGILHTVTRARETRVYSIRNRSPRARRLLLEHPLRPQLTLVDTVRPVEISRDVYRFELSVAPEKTLQFPVTEERLLAQAVVLSNSEDDVLRFYHSQPVLSEPVKAAVEEALKIKGRWNESRAEARRRETELKGWIDDQARVRANLERLHREQDAYKRQLKKLDELETEIEKRQADLRALRAREEKQRRAYEDFLAGLSVE